MGTQLLRSFQQIDYILQGESDRSFDISGLVYRDGTEIIAYPPSNILNDLDSLPIPDYSDYFQQISQPLTQLLSLSLPIEMSRGCWWGEKKTVHFLRIKW